MKISKIDFASENYQQSLGIRREVFVQEQLVPEEIEIDEYEASCDHFLLTLEGVPAATGRMRIKNDLIKFERIATLKKFRGLGLGKELMFFMQDYAVKNYAHLTPYMHSQADAVGFYEKLGWTPQGEIFFEADIPHRIMTKHV